MVERFDATWEVAHGDQVFSTDGDIVVRASDYDALAAALAIVQDTSIAHAGKQNARIAQLEAALKGIRWQKDCGCDFPDPETGVYKNYADVERDAMYRIAGEALGLTAETPVDPFAVEMLRACAICHGHHRESDICPETYQSKTGAKL